MKTLAIDDEFHARQEIARLVELHRPDWTVLGAGSVDEALPLIEAENPDLIFLDIMMPGADGFSLWSRRDRPLPPVIIVSAYAEHALRAFEFHVLDYLLKPIEPGRFAKSIARFEEFLREDGATAHGGLRQLSDHLLICDQARCWFVAIREIAAIESDGNYGRLLGPAGQPMVPRTLDYFEEHLDPKVFFRANRKTIINVQRISGLRRKANGQFTAEIEPLGTVIFSRRQSQIFRQQFGF